MLNNEHDDGDWVKRCMSMGIGALSKGDARERPGASLKLLTASLEFFP